MAIDVSGPPVEEFETGLRADDAVPNAASGPGIGAKAACTSLQTPGFERMKMNLAASFSIFF
jgi:hypothetical protein